MFRNFKKLTVRKMVTILILLILITLLFVDKKIGLIVSFLGLPQLFFFSKADYYSTDILLIYFVFGMIALNDFVLSIDIREKIGFGLTALLSFLFVADQIYLNKYTKL